MTYAFPHCRVFPCPVLLPPDRAECHYHADRPRKPMTALDLRLLGFVPGYSDRRAPTTVGDFREGIEAAVAKLTEDDLRYGITWYVEAGLECRRLADSCEVPFETACLVVAALSPGLRWARNLHAANVVIRAFRAGSQMPRTGFDQTFGIRPAERAWAILTGAGDLSGPKVEAFAANLMGDLDRLTIDRWVIRAATGGEQIQLHARHHFAILEHFRRCARLKGLKVAELQAALWHAAERRYE